MNQGLEVRNPNYPNGSVAGSVKPPYVEDVENGTADVPGLIRAGITPTMPVLSDGTYALDQIVELLSQIVIPTMNTSGQLIFRPGVPASPGVYASLSELWTALLSRSGDVTVFVDGRFAPTPGTVDIPANTGSVPYPPYTNGRVVWTGLLGTTVNFLDGAQLSDPVIFLQGPEVYFTVDTASTTSPFDSANGVAFVIVNDGVTLQSDAAATPLFAQSGADRLVVQVTQSSIISSNVVFSSTTATGLGAMGIFLFGTSMNQELVGGDAAGVALLGYDAASSAGETDTFLGTINRARLSEGTNVAYSGQGGLAADNVGLALDELSGTLTADIDTLVVGDTTVLATVAGSGNGFLIQELIVVATDVNTLTSGPTLNVGYTSPDFDDVVVFPVTATATGVAENMLAGLSSWLVVPNSTNLVVRVDTAAVATAFDVKVLVKGRYL